MTDPFSRYLTSGLQHEKPESPPKPDFLVDRTFYEELSALINKHSKEQASGTPDYILADYLVGCLEVFGTTIQARAQWRGERVDKTFDVKYDEKLKITAYDEHGRSNEIGEADVSIWPGETMRHGKIVGLKAIFEAPSTPEDTNNA